MSKLPIVDQCTGRARFCEDRGEVKTPGLLREAATTITELVSALEQAADNLEAGDRLYKCPGLHAAAKLARTALSNTRGDTK